MKAFSLPKVTGQFKNIDLAIIGVQLSILAAQSHFTRFHPSEDLAGLQESLKSIKPIRLTVATGFAATVQPTETQGEGGWDALLQLVEDCSVETGIFDLAHQHDFYLHGTDKNR